MARSVTVNIFKKENDYIEKIFTGYPILSKNEIVIKGSNNCKKMSIALNNTKISKESVNVIQLQKSKNLYLLDFENERTADLFYNKLKDTIEKHSINDFEDLNKLFRECNSVQKKEICDNLIDNGIIKYIINNRKKDDILIVLKNMNRRVLIELLNYQLELNSIFLQNEKNIALGTKNKKFPGLEKENYENKVHIENNNRERNIIGDKEPIKRIKVTENVTDKPTYSSKMRLMYENTLIEILDSKSIEKIQNFINEEKKLELNTEIKNYNEGKECLTSEELLKIMLSDKIKGRNIKIEKLNLYIINKFLSIENVEILYESCLYLKDDVFSVFSEDIFYKIFLKLREHNQNTQKTSDKDNYKIIYMVKTLYLLFSNKSSIILRKFFYRNVHLIFSKSGDPICLKVRDSKNFYKISHPVYFDLLLFMEEHHGFMFNEFIITSKILFFIFSLKDVSLSFVNKLVYKIISGDKLIVIKHIVSVLNHDKIILESMKSKIRKSMVLKNNDNLSEEAKEFIKILL